MRAKEAAGKAGLNSERLIDRSEAFDEVKF
jgi:hypothetical protein